MQYKIYLFLTVTGSFILHLFEKYLFSDWQFLVFLMVLIGIDTATGFWKHWKLNSVSSKGFAAFFQKVIVYAVFLILTHGLKNFTVAGAVNGLFSWVDNLFYAAIMVREAISIIENLGVIRPGLLPNWILAKLKSFDETGKTQDLQP